jgi:hypothetical protein
MRELIMKDIQIKLLDELRAKFGESASKKEIVEYAEENGFGHPHFAFAPERRVDRGVYTLNYEGSAAKVVKMPATPVASNDNKVVTLSAQTTGFTENLIPAKDELFVPFGNFSMIRDVIKSKMFYPLYITGLSGNGKTFGVEQACAATKREVIRVNFTVETDEDDLIGGFRLVNGETKFFHGPAIKAMQQGAVLLLDEIDLANPAKVMCLQSILEGKGYFIKKTGEFVSPAKGFTVVATANTKGKGSEDGRFIGTNVMNEAFLERFPITVEQEYPSPAIEKKILGKVFTDLGLDEPEFVEKLVDWADIIRKTFMDGGVDEIISTRRLVHIAKAQAIFNDRMKSIEMCTNRFDDDTKLSFMDLYTKVDAGVEVESGEEEVAEPTEYNPPF